jgi:ADP-heptose:LPS heptosyltransferase
LIERYGARIVFTGKGEEEAELVDIAPSEMKHDSIDACDRLSIGELLALLKHADLTIANDTSVMHLASLVGTPVTAFFGATDPLQYGPRNPHDVVLYKDLYCSPCLTNYNLKISYCTNPVCIRSIGVEETLERIDGQLAAIGAVEPGVLQ